MTNSAFSSSEEAACFQNVVYCIVLCCVVLYCIALHCVVLYCIVLCCFVLYCIALYCIVMYCIVFIVFTVTAEIIQNHMGNVSHIARFSKNYMVLTNVALRNKFSKPFDCCGHYRILYNNCRNDEIPHTIKRKILQNLKELKD